MSSLKLYHEVWLAANNKDEAWLKEKLSDGFHIHHIDANPENNAAENLILIWGIDHLMLHSGVRFVIGKNRKKSHCFECGCKSEGNQLTTCDGKVIPFKSRANIKKIVRAYHG